MKIGVKIIGIDYRTLKKVVINKTIESNVDFVDETLPAKTIPVNGKLMTLSPTIVTAKQKADEWFENQSELLNDIIHDPQRELNSVYDWQILWVGQKPPKEKKLSEVEKIGLVFDALQKRSNEEFSDLFKNTFLHCYLSLKPDLKGVSLDRKIRIVLNSMDLSMSAAAKAYKDILEVLNYDKPEIKALVDSNIQEIK